MLSTRFFKIINKDRNHNGFQYKLGLNELPQGEFARIGSCVAGGFYYTTFKHILEFINYGVDLFEVTIPVDAQIRKDYNKFRSDKIILGNHYSLFDISTYKMLKEMGANIDVGKCINFSAKHGSIFLFNYFIESLTCPNYREAFEIAVEHGHLSFAETIVDKVTDYFDYAMHLASKRGHLHIVKFLIEKNPDYDYKHNRDSLKFLIEKNPDYDYKHSPVGAVEHNHLDIVKYLIEKYPKNYCFDLILRIASEHNHEDIFKYIATELSNESNYQLILKLASVHGYLDIVQHFSGLVDSCDFIGYASTAAINGHLSVLKYFINTNTNIIDVINYKNYYVLEVISYLHNDVIKYLIENTVGKINHIDAYTKCVMRSADACNIEIFELVLNILIKDNADINQIFSKNSYKLMNCIPILELAISRGFKPNIEDLSNAVKRAIIKQDLLLIEYLIKSGAILNLSLYDFQRACKNDNLPMVKLLAKNCIDFEKEIFEFISIATQHNHINIIKYLIKEFTLPSDIYTELLRKCITFINLDIVKLFVDLKAKIDTKTIIKAIKCGHLDVIEYFVEHGIVITEDFITIAQNEGYDNIAEYLKKKN